MKNEKGEIRCPKCNTAINVEDVLYRQVAEKAQTELQEKSEQLQAKSQQEFKKRLETEREQLEKKLRAEMSEEARVLKEELVRKSTEVKELHRTRAELVRLQREKDEMSEKIMADAEQKISSIIQEQKMKIAKEAEQKNELKLLEKQNLIDQLNTQLKDAQRKINQGSMQAQGEAQENGIEEFLRTAFPLDEIVEIKKGARGADCLQKVCTRTKANCGSIYYESKRTKEFSFTWIEKFKADMRERAADCGVIVTDVLPKGYERACQIDGIWICTYEEFKALCQVLRESIIQVDSVMSSQENKSGKMNVLYDYLTGLEFRGNVEAIVEGFVQMKSDLDSERRAIEGLWKKREKEITKVLNNTSHMYGSIRAIAGISTIAGLELPVAKVETIKK